MEVNIGEKERLVSAVVGGALLAVSPSRARWAQLPLALAGAGMLFRAASGHCGFYKALGVSSCDGHHQVSCGNAALTREVRAQQTVTINAMPMRVYEFWRDLNNMPLFSENILSVTETGQGISHWVARAHGLDGHNIRWNAILTQDETNRRIEWKTDENSEFQHHGTVTFHPAPGGRGTEVKVAMRYQILGGKLGQNLARLFGEEPGQQIRADLMRLKQLLEAGEVPTAAIAPGAQEG